MPQLCPRHGARQGRAPGAILGHWAFRLAPPLPTRIMRRYYARVVRTRILPGRRDGRPPGLPARALPPLHPRGSRTRPQTIFVLLYIPSLRSLCPFVLKIRALPPLHPRIASRPPRGGSPPRRLNPCKSFATKKP